MDFFQKSISGERKAFLEENQIAYVYFGIEEKSYANFNPDEEVFLEKVYSNSEVSLYKVK